MNDIVEFIEKRRVSFKNPCLCIEPLNDWIFWAIGNCALFYTKTNKDLFDSIGICWRVQHGDHSNSTFQEFIDNFNPFIDGKYDLFVLDFFAENKEARNALISKMIIANPRLNNVWAIRHDKTVKISTDYITKLFKI